MADAALTSRILPQMARSSDGLSGVGWVSAVDNKGRTIWIVDARAYGKRFVVRADEKLTAFLELKLAIRGLSRWLQNAKSSNASA
jgi:hypothetical protein